MRKLKRTVVIVISGKAEAGKTTSALHLMTLLPGFEVKKFMMAWKVKDIAKQMRWDGEKDKKGRRLLQQIGRIGRAYNIDVWVNQAIEAIMKEQPDVAIIDDLRFPNEIDKVRRAFPETYIIRLTRKPLKLRDISETAMDRLPRNIYDLYLENSDLSDAQTNAEIEVWLNNKLVFLRGW